MNNFRTVTAVLAVLLAFTCFQLIANYSLRRAVRKDVQDQIERTTTVKAEMLDHQQRLHKATELMAKLAEQIAAVEAQVTAASAKAAELAKPVDALDAKARAAAGALDALDLKLKALGTELDEMRKKLGAVGAVFGDGAKDVQASVAELKQRADRTDAGAGAASKDAAKALAEVQKLAVGLAQQSEAVKPESFAQMTKDVERIRNESEKLAGEVKKLAAGLEAVRVKGDGT